MLCFLLLSVESYSQHAAKPTNLELFKSLSRQLGDSIVAVVPHDADTLIVAFTQSGESVPVQDQFLSAFKSAGKRVFLDSAVTGANVVALRISPDLKVSYQKIGGGGLSGDSKIERTVTVAADVRMMRQDSREVLQSSSKSQSAVDTLAESEIASAETPGYPATHASLPEGGVLDKLVEPVVILGAVGAMIFLFFHVRS